MEVGNPGTIGQQSAIRSLRYLVSLFDGHASYSVLRTYFVLLDTTNVQRLLERADAVPHSVPEALGSPVNKPCRHGLALPNVPGDPDYGVRR
jgi:hypothetical protein